MTSLTTLFVGAFAIVLVIGCDTKLAMPSGGAAEISQSSSTLNPVTPAASAAHILSGQKAYDSDGNVITGSMANLGVLNLSQTPAASGYYSSTSNAPTNSQICATETILGVIGNRICQDTAMTAVSSNQILSGDTFYDSTGSKRSGSLTTSSGSAIAITGDENNDAVTEISVTPGVNELFSSVLVNLGAEFQKENICSGKTIFGRAGTAVCNALFGDTIYSMAPRSDLATAPTSSSNRSVASISQEASSASAFTSNYDLVPKPEYVTDGRYGNGFAVEKRHHLETIVGRPTVTCGDTGSIEARTSDCATKNTNKAFYSGKNYGQSGEGDWKLVTRTSSGYEVWRDERTKLLWSDTLSQGYNWCQAAGYSSSSSTTSKTGYECQAGGGGLQPATPVSACADASLLSNLNGVTTYETPSAENERKGNLSVSDVKWRLPTIEDWQLANVNGIRKVLPNIDFFFWSASSLSDGVSYAWYFYGFYGNIVNIDRNIDISVRCVGR